MLPKLHLVCSKDESRPAGNHVQITRKDLRATDYTCLAIIPTEQTILDIESLPETPIYLHRDAYKLLTAPSILSIKFDIYNASGQFIAYHKGSKPATVAPLSPMDESYPDFEPLIPKWEGTKPLKQIGVNPRILLNLAEALAEPRQQTINVALGLFAANQAILVRSLGAPVGRTGLIMPVMLTNF
jgi:hypothetical protein